MESKTYVFGENGTNTCGGLNSVLAMLPALLQKQGVDPGLLALCNGRGNGNSWGDNLFAILLLFIIMGRGNFFGGGYGGAMMPNGQGGVVPMINNDANTAVIMQAVQRNGYDVQSLATALNTSSDAVMAAINSLGQQLCNIGNQMGMNTNQVLTALMQGNNAIATQLAECCCKTNNAITAMDGNIKLSICQQTHAINDTANSNALMLRDANQNNTNAIMAKLDQMQTQTLQDKIEALREKNSQQAVIINNGQQSAMFSQMITQATAPIGAAVQSLQSEIAGIKCKLPDTTTVQYSPVVGVPSCVAWQAGLAGSPLANGGFWG